MQKIKILDPQEAIKIAAGEVVERPANILKEVIENSIDAEAKNIVIRCKKAGKEYLSISDDGSGMSSQDAHLCFLHHATSKISSVHDLESISTYGFRGEALSSIASVATVQLTTKTDEQKGATQLLLEQAKLQNEQIVAHPTGTTLEITNLFSTIPARKKFLKSDDTEWNLIVLIFQAFSLRYHSIHFKLFHDEKLFYNCPSTNNLSQRCAQLWGNELCEQLIEIKTVTKNNITLHGATTKPHYHRYNRNQIFIFVNNRWVKNNELSRAVLKGYQGVLPPQKYPATFLFIEIDQKQIDINIHPKKEEVKFLHPGIIQSFIEETISNALKQSMNDLIAPSSFDKKTVLPTVNVYTNSDNTTVPFPPPSVSEKSKDPFHLSITENHFFNEPFSNDQINQNRIEEKTEESLRSTNQFISKLEQVAHETFIEKDFFYKVIGQFYATYIILEKENKLILIDQHAAHERILYEQLKINSKKIATIQLLFPHLIKLSKTDVLLLQRHQELFHQHGIIFEPFNENEIIIQATPVSLQNKATEEIIHTTLSLLKEQDSTDYLETMNESIFIQKACKMACKAGDILNQDQMNTIIQTLLKTEHNFCCPHGRPTMWQLDTKEIEKCFKRDYKAKSSSF
ncbi:DNA mismatch repair endonuclease MutL [Candidatus Dependentiae bacterium]|nr:DNA mismatch repair endonuclease MutL [Candidatus Dependentiae bacterium]